MYLLYKIFGCLVSGEGLVLDAHTVILVGRSLLQAKLTISLYGCGRGWNLKCILEKRAGLPSRQVVPGSQEGASKTCEGLKLRCGKKQLKLS